MPLFAPSTPWRPVALATAGFSALYAVAVVFFYCDWLFDVPGADPLVYGAALNLSLCAAAGIVFFAAWLPWWREGVAAGAGAALYAVALAALVAAVLGTSTACAYGAGAAAGAAVGVLMPLWFARMSALAGERYPVVLGIGSLVAAPAALLLDLLPAAALAAACAVLVTVAVALLFRTPFAADGPDAADGKGADEGEEGEGTRAPGHAAEGVAAAEGADHRAAATEVDVSGRPVGVSGDAVLPPAGEGGPSSLVIPGLYVLILSFAYGMLDVVAMASPVATAALSGFASQVGGLVAIAVFLGYVRRGHARYAALLNGALAVVATGVLFLPFLPQGYSVVLVVLTHTGWEVALLVLYALAIGAFRGVPAALLGWGALAFALPRPALLAGSVTASLLADGDQFAFSQMTVVAFALLYLIVSGVALLRNREQRAYDRALRRKDEIIRRYQEARRDVLGLACEELAASRGLTKREAELLRIFAQGRDAAYAERTLFLSRNTVKSYAKSLYVKLGVHSKQEVIDLVNASLPTDF